MKSKTHQNRWQNLFYIFVALAKGNFSYRIRRTKNNDELEALVELSNMLTEELQETFKHHGFVNPRRTYMYLSKMDFHLDKNFCILNFSKEVPDLLHIPAKDLLNLHFREILDSPSLQKWEEIIPKLNEKLFKRLSLDLNFSSSRDLLIPANCYVSSLFNPMEKVSFTISSYTPVVLDETASRLNSGFYFSEGKEEYRSPIIFNRQSDVRKAHQVRDFLLQNLGKDIPDMKDLTRKFFTNESKLKADFRAVFGTTPFQFIKQERLKLAKELVQNTSLPLKNISHTCGFNNYPHFSYAFKDEYGISPKQLRNSTEEES